MSSNITECKQGYRLDFWCKIDKKPMFSNTYVDLEKANKKANELDIEYYYKHRYLLPNGISINYKDKIFNIIVKTEHLSGEKSIKLGSARTLKEINQIRINLIKKLI